MNIVAIITSRWNSTRLPGKALVDICGKPMLWHIVNRVKHSRLINEVIVATDTKSFPIVEFAERNNIPIYEGKTDDILDRLYQTAKKFEADVIVRVWGDCPLVNEEIIDEVIKFFIEGHYDYAYNTKCPEGQTVAVISFEVLEKAWEIIEDPRDREWIHTYFINKSLVKIGVLEAEKDWSGIKLSVDTKEDLERARGLIERSQAGRELRVG